MSLASLLVQDVTIVTPSLVVDRYGNLTKDWATATRLDVRGWVARRSQLEVRDGREAEVSEWTGYFFAGTDITGADRLEWDGMVFEVNGPPLRAKTPRGEHHVEVPLDVVEG